MSLAKKTKALATSSGSPMRPSGMVAMMGLMTSSGRLATISVLVTPGATALTRIPMGASSRESDWTIPLTANLDVG